MVFNAYASYYDLLYQDKDYSGEVNYISSHIRESAPEAKLILELGCGTGAHAEHLARMGYTVHGVDMSKEMLIRAEERKAGLPADVASRLSFSLGDVRSVRTEKTYDVVISLFHVMSYQTSNNDLAAAFETAATHLSIDGLFLFDFWYSPAVLIQKPDVRVKRLEDDEIKVTRIAEPEMHVNQNMVDVNYTVFIDVKSTGAIEQVQETHHMRYFSLPELQCFWRSMFQDCGAFGWMTDREADASTWACFQKLKRI
jgi:SAM-dependent methyltransferase